MRKKEQIIALNLLILFCAVSSFIYALITKEYFNTIIGFTLLLGHYIIKFSAKKEVKPESYEIIVNGKSTKTDEPKVIFDFGLVWKKILNWLNN